MRTCRARAYLLEFLVLPVHLDFVQLVLREIPLEEHEEEAVDEQYDSEDDACEAAQVESARAG